MLINFLTGSLIFRKNKTGVHIEHENLAKYSINDTSRNHQFKISCYNKKDEVWEFCQAFINKSNCEVLFSNKIVRLLCYFLPVELFFGRSDVYICDGLIPHTIFQSKKIAIIQDLMVKIYPENYSTLKKLYLDYYFWRCKKADRIIAISETTKKDVIKYLGISEDKIEIANCGYEPVDLSNVSTERIDADEKFVFYVGDMRKNKNLLNAIKGVELVVKENPSFKFYIAGKKDFEFDKLYEYVKNNGLTQNVVFLGYISNEEKAELYKKSLALLFVSYYEGFGIPILEAAANSTAVITSNVSSMKEIADGVSILVDPNDIQSIRDAIVSLFDEKERRLMVEKQKQLLIKYTWKNSYNSFIRIIEDSVQDR